MTSLVVLAVGNDARGDDALGPLLMTRLEALDPPGVARVLDFQLQVEHALDLDGVALALFVDAHCRQEVPVALAPIQAEPTTGASHALSPAQVLGVGRRIGRAMPEAWLMSLAGADFSLGQGLSPVGQASLEAGWRCLQALLANPTGEAWRALAQGLGELAGVVDTLGS